MLQIIHGHVLVHMEEQQHLVLKLNQLQLLQSQQVQLQLHMVVKQL